MLSIVATPIGNYQDITLRARDTLSNCDFLIGEEHRVASTLLKKIGLEQKEIYLLNEHTKDKDLAELVELCRNHHVALVTDCGTPGFSDPGSKLVRACRSQKIPMTSLPGASALTLLLSLSSERIDQFLFRGFLPANNEERQKALLELKKVALPWIIMDTPYRLQTTLDQLSQHWPKSRALIVLNLTQENENILEASFSELKNLVTDKEAEFMILKYAN